jgi:hypothetical protein
MPTRPLSLLLVCLLTASMSLPAGAQSGETADASDPSSASAPADAPSSGAAASAPAEEEPSPDGEPTTDDEAAFADASADEAADEDAKATTPARGPLRMSYRSLNGARFNPLGLISSNRIGIRYRLYESDNPLLKNNFAGVSILPTLSGGFGRFGAMAEIQPLSVMRLWARFEAFQYWGIFNLFQSFSDASSDYSDTKQRDLGALEAGDPQKNYPTWGTQLTVGADLMIKVGPVVGRSFSRLVRSDFNMRPNDSVFYEQLYDVLAPNNGFYAHNDTDLLGYLDLSFLDLLQGMRVVGGIRNTVTIPVYTDAHFAPDNLDRHRPTSFAARSATTCPSGASGRSSRSRSMTTRGSRSTRRRSSSGRSGTSCTGGGRAPTSRSSSRTRSSASRSPAISSCRSPRVVGGP